MREKEVEAPSTEQGRTDVESNIYRPWLWASLLGWGNGVLHSYVIMSTAGSLAIHLFGVNPMNQKHCLVPLALLVLPP